MPKRGRFRKATSDRSGFDCLERELVKDKSSKVTSEERDDPPPSKISLGGEGDVSQGAYFRSSTSLTIEAQVENPTFYLTPGSYSPDTNGAIASGIKANWLFDDASNIGLDSWGSNHLTNNNAVTTTQGLIGSAALFTASSQQSLSISDNPKIKVSDGGVFSFAIWVNPSATGAASDSTVRQRRIAMKGDDTSGVNTGEWRIRMMDTNTSARATFYIDGGASNVFTQTGPMIPNQWNLLTIWHDSTNQQVGIRLDTNAAVTLGYSSGIIGRSGAMVFGIQDNNTISYWDGGMEDARFWKGKVLTNQEIIDLFNSRSSNTFTPNPITPTYAHPYMRVSGSNDGLTLTANPRISIAKEGRTLTLFCTDSSITIPNGNSISLLGSNNALLTSGSIISFMYNTANNAWNETSRVSPNQGLGG